MINSDKSSRKDKRIGSIIHSCLSRGVITAEDYEIIGEATKMNTDMAFAKQLGLVELLPDGNYEINKALKNSFNKIEKGTKNILSEMYSIFGDTKKYYQPAPAQVMKKKIFDTRKGLKKFLKRKFG